MAPNVHFHTFRRSSGSHLLLLCKQHAHKERPGPQGLATESTGETNNRCSQPEGSHGRCQGPRVSKNGPCHNGFIILPDDLREIASPFTATCTSCMKFAGIPSPGCHIIQLSWGFRNRTCTCGLTETEANGALWQYGHVGSVFLVPASPMLLLASSVLTLHPLLAPNDWCLVTWAC